MAPGLHYLSFISLASLVLAAPAANVSPTVTISNGVVVGTQTSVSNQPSQTAKVNAYLGVPFAQSPPQRFSPPSAAARWSTPLQAQALKPACIQQFVGSGDEQARLKQYFNNPLGPPPAESEDCLYLNVYTPANATANSKLPVMFWLFGGNLQFGTGSLAYYNGSSLAANENVVVVTINYRTNIFGFSNSPEIPYGSQNAGFLDQRFALNWVTNNIASFGGDPAQVMIFGESAGGESVKQILAQPPSPLPFRAAIMESEQAALPGDGTANYNAVLAHFGCTNIDCLRKVPATDIKNYIEPNFLFFPPVIDGTYMSDVRPSITSGKFAKVPITMGTNLDEFRVFLAIFGFNNGSAAEQYFFNYFGLNNTIINSTLATYAEQGYTAAYDVAARFTTDFVFTCTTASLANYLSFFNYTVYRYQYDADFPNLRIFPNSGVYHTVEIPSVWGTYALVNQLGAATQQQIQLSAYMQGIWSGFAKGQAPNWPQVTALPGHYLGLLGANGSTGVTVVNNLNTDYACPLYGPFEDLAGLSY